MDGPQDRDLWYCNYVDKSSFDGAGQWSVGGTCPPGFEGLVVEFQSFGYHQIDDVGARVDRNPGLACRK